MILSAIFHFLKTILGYAIKIIAWLLVALSLWVPLLYTLIFVVVCGLTGASITAVQSWFWGGLAVSFVGSFLISTYIYERRIARKKRQKAEPAPAANIEKVKEKQDETLIKKRDGELPESDDLTQESGLNGEKNYPGFPPVSNMGSAPSADRTSANGPSLMDRLKQGSPELKSNDIAGKYNFISYDAINNPESSQEPVNNQKPVNNQNGFANKPENFASYPNYNSGGGFDFNAPPNNNFQNNFNAGGENGYFQNNSRGDRLKSGAYEGFSDGFSRNEDNVSFGRPASDTLSRSGLRDGYNNGFSSNFSDENSGGGAAANQENPKIFATHSDPTVLIYEYSDRLEYYKRTRSGLLLFKTRLKEASSD